MARIIVLSNPLNPHDRIEYDWVGPYCANDGESGFLNKEYPDGFPGTHRTFLNREYLPVEEYDRHLGPLDEVVLLVTPGIFGAIVAAIGAAIGAAGVGSAVASLAVGLALTAVSYLLAPKPGNLSAPQRASALAQPKADSIYSLSVPQNQNRLGNTIPVAYGRNRIVPDYASTPYSFYDANDQYVDMLLCLGQGEHNIHEIYLADTPVSQLSAGIVDWASYPPASHAQTFGNVTDIYENVYTSPEVADQELIGPEERIDVDGISCEVISDTELAWRSGTTDFSELTPGTKLLLSNGTTTTLVSITPQLTNGVVTGADLVVTGGILTEHALPVNATGTMQAYLSGTDLHIINIDFRAINKVLDPYDPIRVVLTGVLPAQVEATGEYSYQNFNTVIIENVVFTTGSVPAPPGEELRALELYGTSKVGNQVNVSWYAEPTDIGPFAVCPPRETIHAISIDIIWPSGLYEADEETGDLLERTIDMEATFTPIDDAGTPTAGAVQTVNFAITMATNTPQRRTYEWPVPIGRYAVSVTRVTQMENQQRFVDRTVFAGLRGKITAPTGPVYGDVHLLAMRVKATNGLSQDVLNRVSVDCTRILAGVETRSADNALRDIITNTNYGAGRPPLEVDGNLSGYFDAVFDFDSTVWEAATLVVQAVNGQILPYGRTFRIKMGDPSTTPRMRFKEGTAGGGLIVDGSLVRRYALGNRSEEDGIEVEYRDPITYQPAYALHPGNAVRPREMQLLGCSDPTIAQNRAERVWREEQYNRFIWSFESELDALVLEPGDTIEITPLYGQPVLCVVSEVENNGPYRSSVTAFEYDARVYA